MADYKFFADMCIAVCVDCDKLKEKIIYGEPKKVFNYVKGGLFAEKSVEISEREIGSLLFDLSSDCKMLNYLKGSRVIVPDSNVTCGYLKKVIDKAYFGNLISNEDELEWLCNHLEITQTALINRDFEYHQRHISFTPSREPNTDQALDYLLNRYVKDDMPIRCYRCFFGFNCRILYPTAVQQEPFPKILSELRKIVHCKVKFV